MKKLLYVLVGLAALGGSILTAIAIGAGASTGTNTACATATIPPHSLTDSLGGYTISGTSTSACTTATYTIPTTTVTVSGSSSSTTSTTPTTTTSTTSTTTTTPPAGQWVPPQDLRWYWQLASVPTTPRANIDATDFDGFDGTAANVATYHSAGQHVICYIDVGTAENWRSDYSQFPAALLGSTVSGYSNEHWLNVSPSGPDYSTLQSIMTARFQMCQQKGFDAVEPDNMDGSENSTGFTISKAQNEQYDEWVAQTVHSLGMAVFQKNFSDASSVLQPYFDGVISEQQVQYGDSYTPYETAGKPHLDAEYKSEPCQSPPTVMQAQFSVNLDGSTFKPCW